MIMSEPENICWMLLAKMPRGIWRPVQMAGPPARHCSPARCWTTGMGIEWERVMELPNVWKHVNLVGYYRSWRCVLRGSLAKSRRNLSRCILSKTFGHLSPQFATVNHQHDPFTVPNLHWPLLQHAGCEVFSDIFISLPFSIVHQTSIHFPTATCAIGAACSILSQTTCAQ